MTDDRKVAFDRLDALHWRVAKLETMRDEYGYKDYLRRETVLDLIAEAAVEAEIAMNAPTGQRAYVYDLVDDGDQALVMVPEVGVPRIAFRRRPSRTWSPPLWPSDGGAA